MAEVKPKRSRLQNIFLIIIIATIPFYILGLIVLWVGNAAISARATKTPTATLAAVVQPSATPTLFTATPTVFTTTTTQTPTTTPTFTITATYFIPSSTPSQTPSPTASLTPTPTLAPSATPSTPTP